MFTKKVFLSGIFALSSLSVFSQITYTNPTSIVYSGYGNTIIVDGVKNPTFQVSNAEMLASEKPNTIKIIPNSNVESVKLTVLSQGKVVDTKDFKVTKLPLATVQFTTDGKAIEFHQGFDPILQNTAVQIVPTAEVQELFAKETKYKAKITCHIKRNGKTFFTKENISLGESLDDIFKKTQKGDILVIKTESVERTNFKGEHVSDKVSNPVLMVPIK